MKGFMQGAPIQSAASIDSRPHRLFVLLRRITLILVLILAQYYFLSSLSYTRVYPRTFAFLDGIPSVAGILATTLIGIISTLVLWKKKERLLAFLILVPTLVSNPLTMSFVLKHTLDKRHGANQAQYRIDHDESMQLARRIHYRKRYAELSTRLAQGVDLNEQYSNQLVTNDSEELILEPYTDSFDKESSIIEIVKRRFSSGKITFGLPDYDTFCDIYNQPSMGKPPDRTRAVGTGASDSTEPCMRTDPHEHPQGAIWSSRSIPVLVYLGGKLLN